MAKSKVSDKRYRVETVKLAVDYATHQGYDLDRIADICGVTSCTVMRWGLSGKVDDHRKVALLLAELKKIEGYDVKTMANYLICMYEVLSGAYRILKSQFRRLSKVSGSGVRYFEDVQDRLNASKYDLIETYDGSNDVYVVCRPSDIRNAFPTVLPGIDASVLSPLDIQVEDVNEDVV